jgi:autotransporter-associated beta strand protein
MIRRRRSGWYALVVAAWLAGPAAAGAATCTWTGLGASNVWSAAANWDNCGGDHQTPQAGDDLIFPSGAARAASVNDLGSLGVASVRITGVPGAGSRYVISGDGVVLGGELAFNAPPDGAAQGPAFDAPITLGAASTISNIGTAPARLGAIDVNGFPLLFAPTGANLEVAGTISGAGPITNNAARTLILHGANTFTGPMQIDGGTVLIDNNASLGSASVGTTIATGGRLMLRFVQIMEPLTLSGGVIAATGVTDAYPSSSIVADIALTADSFFDATGLGGPGESPSTLGFQGAISGAARLTTRGAIAVFTPSPAFTGPTTVEGSLDFKFPAAGWPNSAVTSLGDTLGQGTVASITAPAGYVSPNGEGLRTGNVVLGPNATFQPRLYPWVDTGASLHVTGTVDLANARLFYRWYSAQAVVLIDNDGTDPVVGRFAGFPEGTRISSYPVLYLSYLGGDGNDVTISSTDPTPPTGPPPYTMVSSRNSSVVTDPVTFTATVAPEVATGSVAFTRDGAVIAGCEARPLARFTAIASCVHSFERTGEFTIVATYTGDGGHPAWTSPPLIQVVLDTPSTVHYFAEGEINFFKTTIGVVNAAAIRTGIEMFFRTELPTGGTWGVLYELPPLTRRTTDLLEGQQQGGTQFRPRFHTMATTVNAAADTAATRRMTWGTPVHGTTLASGALRPWFTWYFAEGATGPFSLFYLIDNPGEGPANVTLTHLLEGGGPAVVQQVVVPAHTRVSLPVNDVPGLQSAAFSTMITADRGIVAERAMYLSSPTRVWEAGTAGRGTVFLSRTWHFAEGATGFFHTYLLIGNPGSTDASATVRYLLDDGTVVTRTHQIAAASRRTIDVNLEDPRLGATTFGMTVVSTVPVVAERSMWWGSPFWYGGSVALGATSPGIKWGIGEGMEGGPTSNSTFVQVANGASAHGTVRFTVVYDDATTETRDYALLADARLTVHIGDVFARARNARFSVIVESLTPGVKITVETAQYGTGPRTFESGDATLATKLR